MCSFRMAELSAYGWGSPTMRSSGDVRRRTRLNAALGLRSMNEMQRRILSALPVIVPVLCLVAGTRTWLLFSSAAPRILGLAVGVAAGGGLLLWLDIIEEKRLLVAFVAPLVQILLIRAACLGFRGWVGRWPADVAFNWSSSRGFIPDRIFLFLTTFVSIVVPVLWIRRF